MEGVPLALGRRGVALPAWYRGRPREDWCRGQIGYFRRNHFVPVPEVASLTELNELVDQWDQDDEARRLRGRTIGDYFAAEQHLLAPLPTEPFETGRRFTPRVDRFSRISVRDNVYSVMSTRCRSASSAASCECCYTPTT
ncbi:hypothetical protein GCM10017687_68050 [Streptomyces echinatus]